MHPEDVRYDPLLILCTEGLLDVAHPYNFLARQCSTELLQASNSKSKVIPILSSIITNLRIAISHKNENVYSNALKILELLTTVVKEQILPFIQYLIQPLNRLMAT